MGHITVTEAEFTKRITALERIIATLSAEIDLMRPVMDAAIALSDAVDNYETTKKERSNG